MNPSLQQAVDFLEAGRFDDAFRSADALKACFDAGLEERHLARVLYSMILLPRLRLDDVRRCWSDYVYEEGPELFRPDTRGRLEKGLGEHPIVRGLVHGELGNLGFRLWDRAAEWHASIALDLLQTRAPSTLPRRFLDLARIHATVWWCRLASQGDEPAIARDRLQSLRLDIKTRPDRLPLDPGFDLAEAIVLDLTADRFAAEGQMEKALDLIQQAAALVTSGRDSCRMAHIYYQYGKIVAPLSSTSEWPRRLFTRSRFLYPDRHPFRYRSANQEAQVLARFDRLPDAKTLLEEQSSDLKSDESVPKTLRRIMQVDFELTKSWILEREAIHRPERWDAAWKHADCILTPEERETMPRRIRAEVYLHQGRALTHLGRTAKAIRTLKEGLRHVDTNSAKVAIQFALAEAYLRKNQMDTARSWWEEGRLGKGSSRFLSQWSERLAPAFEELRIKARDSYDDAFLNFQEQYLRFHLRDIWLTEGRKARMADLHRVTGKHPNSWKRWIDDIVILKKIDRKDLLEHGDLSPGRGFAAQEPEPEP